MKIDKEAYDALTTEIENVRRDVTSEVRTLGEQLHDRISKDRRQLEMEIASARRDFQHDTQDLSGRVSTLEAKPCSDVALHVANEHGRQGGGSQKNGSWTLLRDLALIATLLGVAYGIMKDLFVMRKDVSQPPIMSNSAKGGQP